MLWDFFLLKYVVFIYKNILEGVWELIGEIILEKIGLRDRCMIISFFFFILFSLSDFKFKS